MQREAERIKPEHLLYLWGAVFVYFCMNAIALSGVSEAAGRDQAEQLILSQSFLPGYSAQPPLYTYIARTVFFLTGPGPAPLLALKAVLLSLLVGSLIATGEQFRFTFHQQLVAVAGVAFIPQFIWESQRDLTHSVLATTIAAATLLQLARTRRGPTTSNYVALGALIGLGLISKYNYALFVTALALAVFATPRYRVLLANRRVVATLVAAAAVAAPHLFWLASNFEIAASSVHKLHISDGDLASGLAGAAVSALAFIAPLLIFSTILVTRPVRRGIPENTEPGDRRLLLNLLLVTLVIVALFVVTSGAQRVADRWYQPLLFYAPLLVAMSVTPTTARLNWYLGLGLGLALLVSLGLLGRITLAERLGKYSPQNMPYPELMESIAGMVRKPAFILAEKNLLGGNARPVFPDAIVQVPGYKISFGTVAGDGLVVCETPDCDNGKFREWLAGNYAIDVRRLKFDRIEMPYRYAPSQLASIYFSRVSLSP